MALVLIAAFIGLWLTVRFVRSEARDEDGSVNLAALLGCLVTALLMFAASMAGYFIGERFREQIDPEPNRVVELVALQSAEGFTASGAGSIFLMHLRGGTSEYYRFYERFRDGLRPNKVCLCGGTYVFEVDERFRYERFGWHHVEPWWISIWGIYNDDGLTHYFYVPKGSVRRTFDIQP